jgi:hypothetical protein
MAARMASEGLVTVSDRRSTILPRAPRCAISLSLSLSAAATDTRLQK